MSTRVSFLPFPPGLPLKASRPRERGPGLLAAGPEPHAVSCAAAGTWENEHTQQLHQQSWSHLGYVLLSEALSNSL